MNLEGARFDRSKVYGLSAWNIVGRPESQRDLPLTPKDESPIIVDDLEVAQFIYLLIYNPKIRHVIDTVTSKVVLILGRFSKQQKPTLDRIRSELRSRDYVPMLFDFDKPQHRAVRRMCLALDARRCLFRPDSDVHPGGTPSSQIVVVEPFARGTEAPRADRRSRPTNRIATPVRPESCAGSVHSLRNATSGSMVLAL